MISLVVRRLDTYGIGITPGREGTGRAHRGLVRQGRLERQKVGAVSGDVTALPPRETGARW